MAESGKVPSWAIQPPRALVEYVTEVGAALRLAHRGISSLAQSAQLTEALANYDLVIEEIDREEADRRVEQGKREAEAAKESLEKGFPILAAHGLVGMYGSLEVLVKTLVKQWLIHRPSVMSSPKFPQLKILLSDYLAFDDPQDRAEFLVDEIEHQTRSSWQQGVNRFEFLLACIGLDGSVDDDVKQGIYELQHVRNLIVHCMSVADKKFVTACPQLGYKAGERVLVSSDMYATYSAACDHYAATVFARVGQQFGVEVPTAKALASIKAEGQEKVPPSQEA